MNEDERSIEDMMEEMENAPADVHQAMLLRDDAVEYILDGLTDGVVKAFHEFGRRSMAQVHVSEIDCKDCGALFSFNIICPVDDFHFILKETLKDKKIQETINRAIKKGRDFNARKGFNIRRSTEQIPETESKGHNIKID